MIEFPENLYGGHPKTAREKLAEIIGALSESQQERLLEVVRKWTNDKRNYPRKECCAEVHYSDNVKLSQGTVVNLNAEGLYIQTDTPFRVGTALTLSFDHPFTKHPMKIKGEIVRSDKKGIAVILEHPIDPAS